MGIAVLLCALSLFAAPTQAGIVGVSSAHATLSLPSGWIYERNYTDTDSGLKYDLMISNQAGTSAVFGLFFHEAAPGNVDMEDTEGLYEEIRAEMESGGFTDISYIVAPRNITIGGLPACDLTISADAGMVLVTERATAIYSSDWHQIYMFVFAVASTGWLSYSSSIDSIVMSLSVDEKVGGGLSSAMTLALIGVVVAAIVVVLVVYLLMRKKKPESMMAPPPEMASAPSGMPPSMPPSQ